MSLVYPRAALTGTSTAWTTARIVTKDRPTPTTVRLRMHVEGRKRHRPGQHYLIRLRAPNGYTAQRPYSVASDDDDPLIEFLVERMPNGEVSKFIADLAEIDDVLEVRGPIGKWFTWDASTPALCLVGGTGVVPAVAMTRTADRILHPELLRVVAVGRTPETLPYSAELTKRGATMAYTHHQSPRPAGPPTADEVTRLLVGIELAYICGSSRFAPFAERLLIECGLNPHAMRIEQFGSAQEESSE
jgi:ferredoxin-NADP reductase